MPTGEKGKSYKENMEYHHGTSWKVKLRVAVDKAIWTSINYEEFLQKMQLAGYEVRQGKHLLQITFKRNASSATAERLFHF